MMTNTIQLLLLATTVLGASVDYTYVVHGKVEKNKSFVKQRCSKVALNMATLDDPVDWVRELAYDWGSDWDYSFASSVKGDLKLDTEYNVKDLFKFSKSRLYLGRETSTVYFLKSDIFNMMDSDHANDTQVYQFLDPVYFKFTNCH